MHWLDGCSRIWVVGGYLSGTLEGGRMGDNLKYYSQIFSRWVGVKATLPTGK